MVLGNGERNHRDWNFDWELHDRSQQPFALRKQTNNWFLSHLRCSQGNSGYFTSVYIYIYIYIGEVEVEMKLPEFIEDQNVFKKSSIKVKFISSSLMRAYGNFKIEECWGFVVSA